MDRTHGIGFSFLNHGTILILDGNPSPWYVTIEKNSLFKIETFAMLRMLSAVKPLETPKAGTIANECLLSQF